MINKLEIMRILNDYLQKQRINNARILANDIAKSADSLYALGPGNQKYL